MSDDEKSHDSYGRNEPVFSENEELYNEMGGISCPSFERCEKDDEKKEESDAAEKAVSSPGALDETAPQQQQFVAPKYFAANSKRLNARGFYHATVGMSL